MRVVCMVKLSQQIQQVEGARITRTQRRIAVAERERKTREFQALQQKAEQVRKEKFSNIKSVEEYEEKYKLLDPEVQPFFATPTDVKEQQQQRIADTRTKVEERITFSDSKIKELESKYRQKVQYLNEKGAKTEDYNRAEDNYEENRAYWVGYKQGLQQGLGELSKGKDISFNDIDGYAGDLGQVKEYNEEQRNRAKNERLKQRKQISELVEQGYTPQLIQKFKDGKLEETTVSFYNPQTKQYAKIKPVPIQTQEVSGLKVSELGKVKTPLTYEFGGKKFQFEPTQQLYLSPKGELITPLGKTGKTEVQVKEIQAQQQQAQIRKALVKWEEENKENIAQAEKREFDFTRGRKEVPLYFASGTAMDQPMTTFVEDVEPPKFDIGKAFGTLRTKVLGDFTLPLYISGDFKKAVLPSISIGQTGIISPVKLRETDIKLSEVKKSVQEDLTGKIQKVFEEDIKKQGILEKLEPEYQARTQFEFEREYLEPILKEEITFEKAQEQFAESKEAKQIQKDFEKAIEEERAGKFTAGGFKIAGLGLAKSGVALIPTTVEGAVTEGALIYTGYKVLTAIPPAVSTVATAGIGAYGTVKALSPTASPEEKAGGVITAGISFTILGYQAVKYLRTPTVKQKIIKFKTPKVKDLGRDILVSKQPVVQKDILGQTRLIQTQKGYRITEQAIYGRRTVVSTRFRELIRLPPVYKGVPYVQPAGYQKALKLVTTRSFEFTGLTGKTALSKAVTTAQGKALLRYIQPKYIVTTADVTQAVTMGAGIETPEVVFKGVQTTTKPVLTIDKQLGIKTRGGRALQETFFGKAFVSDIKGQQVISGSINIEKQALTQTGKPVGDVKFVEESFTKVIVPEGKDIYTISIWAGKDKFAYVLPRELFRSAGVSKQIVPSKPATITTERAGLIRYRGVPAEEKLLGKFEKVSYPTAKDIIKKVKTPKLRTAGQWNAFVKTQRELYGLTPTKTQVLKTQLNKLISGGKKGASAVTQVTAQRFTELKAILTPKVTTATAVSQTTLPAQTVATSQALGLGLASASAISTRQALTPKLDVSVKNLLRDLIKEDTAIKEDVIPSEAVKSATQQIAMLDVTETQLPRVTKPTILDIPVIKPPKAP